MAEREFDVWMSVYEYPLGRHAITPDPEAADPFRDIAKLAAEYSDVYVLVKDQATGETREFDLRDLR